MKNPLSSKAKRVWELDFLRGFSILMVIIDHAMLDYGIFFGWEWSGSGIPFLENVSSVAQSYLYSDVRTLWRPAFLFIFFCTSGICTAFSRNNFYRGLKLAFVAAAISIVTYYVQQWAGVSCFILFGVLHCMAAIILIYSLVALMVELIVKLASKLLKKPFNALVYKYALSAVCLIIAVVGFVLNAKYNVKLQDVFNNYDTVQTDSKILGLFFFVRNWWTADYFPLFPFLSFFFLGASVSQILYPRKKSLFPYIDDGVWHVPFTFPGKYSLIFYIGGQLVVLAIGLITNLICFGTAF